MNALTLTMTSSKHYHRFDILSFEMNIDVKISVIIPSYKPQSYLWECLDSVCGQTFPKEEYEVILVLNGCKEPYDGQIREYIGSHRDIQWKYIHTDEGGVSNARNLALDLML